MPMRMSSRSLLKLWSAVKWGIGFLSSNSKHFEFDLNGKSVSRRWILNRMAQLYSTKPMVYNSVNVKYITTLARFIPFISMFCRDDLVLSVRIYLRLKQNHHAAAAWMSGEQCTTEIYIDCRKAQQTWKIFLEFRQFRISIFESVFRDKFLALLTCQLRNSLCL